MSLAWIFPVYFLERLFEVWLARRNFTRLKSIGAKEYSPESYRAIVVLHLLFWSMLMFEAWPWSVSCDLLTVLCLVALGLLMLLRYWCIISLGPFWNTRIIVVPGGKRIRSGPYRWLRHPNYLVVTLEFAILPLLMRAPLTLVIFSLGNLVLLRRRINLEEQALASHCQT